MVTFWIGKNGNSVRYSEGDSVILSNGYTLDLPGEATKTTDTLRYHVRPTKSELFWVSLSIVVLKNLFSHAHCWSRGPRTCQDLTEVIKAWDSESELRSQ